MQTPATQAGGMGQLAIGLQSVRGLSPSVSDSMATMALMVVAAGGTVFIADSDPLLAENTRLRQVFGEKPFRSSLAYGQPTTLRGLHVVSTETTDWAENLAGLGACGAHLIVGAVSTHPREGHPLLPVLQFAPSSEAGLARNESIDGSLTGVWEQDRETLGARIAQVASRTYVPAATAQGLTHFQLTRGLLGIST